MVKKNGFAPWRIQQLYSLALESLKAERFARAIELAGTMSHYIGDLSQPLHVTEFYDGEQEADEGIHMFFETTILNNQDKEKLMVEVVDVAQALLQDPEFVASAGGAQAVDMAFREMERAYPFNKRILNIDRVSGRTGNGPARQLVVAKARLADGIATLALIYTRLWQEGGMQDQGLTFKPTDPAFVPVDFAGQSSEAPMSAPHTHGASRNLADDCQQ